MSKISVFSGLRLRFRHRLVDAFVRALEKKWPICGKCAACGSEIGYIGLPIF